MTKKADADVPHPLFSVVLLFSSLVTFLDPFSTMTHTPEELATLRQCAKKLSVASRNTQLAFAQQCELVAMVEKDRIAWKKDPETSPALKKSCSNAEEFFACLEGLKDPDTGELIGLDMSWNAYR